MSDDDDDDVEVIQHSTQTHPADFDQIRQEAITLLKGTKAFLLFVDDPDPDKEKLHTIFAEGGVDQGEFLVQAVHCFGKVAETLFAKEKPEDDEAS